MTWLLCPAHDTTAPHGRDRLAHGYDPSAAASVAVALLAEGHCPACPSVRLAPTTQTLYGREYPMSSCECCGALWELDDAEYIVHARGALIAL